jgi:hypothetical protein
LLSQVPRAVSEAMGVNGGALSDLFTNVVESSSVLDRWTVFLRETLQNSNDQRLDTGEPVRFGLHYQSLEGSGFEILQSMINQDSPHSKAGDINFPDDLERIPLLVVVDSMTVGLNGATDPQVASDDSNFCNFFFFSGQLESRHTGGGSFGIGRNVLFSASKLRTIVVYSETEVDGSIEKRFMAMAAGKSFRHAGRQFTGRHWWGIEDEARPGGVLPITGDRAEELAKKLGLHSHLKGSTGTAIGVVAPLFEDPQLEMESLRDAIIVNAWPHLLHEKGKEASLSIELSLNGEPIDLGDVRGPTSPVKDFVTAYLRDESVLKVSSQILTFHGNNDAFKTFNVAKDFKSIGEIVWVKTIENEAPALKYMSMGLVKGSSVALMRSPKIIVRYLPVDEQNDGSIVKAVFEVDPNYEEVFRKSENVLHDEWQPKRLRLNKGQMNPVAQAIDKIEKAFARAKNPLGGASQGGDEPTQIANELGKLMAGMGVTGGASGRGGTGGGGTGRVKRPNFAFRLESNPRVVSIEGSICEGEFIFRAKGDPPEEHVVFTPVVKVWLGDTVETDPPRGSVAPQVKGVTVFSEGEEPKAFNTSSIDSSSIKNQDLIRVRVLYPNDVQVLCEIAVQ